MPGALRAALAQDGWAVEAETGLDNGRAPRTRYTVALHWQQYDVCVPRLDPAYSYDIALIDNDDGREVLKLCGRGCEHRIVETFLEGLHSPN